MCCARPHIDLRPIRAAFDAGAPFGWQSQVRAEGAIDEQSPDIHPGMRFVVDYVPCQDDDGRPTRPHVNPPEMGRDAAELDDRPGADTCAYGQSHAISQAPSYEGAADGGAGPDQSAATDSGASGGPIQSHPSGLGTSGEPDAPDTAQDSQHTPRSECDPPGQALPFMLFSPEYKPEGISTGLLPPTSLHAVVALIEQLRAPSAHRRSPRLVPVLPQPPRLPAVFLALPSWPMETLTVLMDCHLPSRRVFAAAVPHFFSREDVLLMAGIDPSLSCQVFHRDVPWAIPTGYWIYPSEGDWIGIFPDDAQPGPLPTISQYLQGEAVAVRSDVDFWDSDVAWVLSNGPCMAAPIPEDNFAINSAQAAAALGLHPGRFVLVPAVAELSDHSYRGAPSRRVLLAKQTEDWREADDSAAAYVPYILDLRPVLLPLFHAEAEGGVVNVAALCQRFMPRCPQGFHVRLYGGAFDADEGNHVRRVQAGDTLVVEYHPNYVRATVSQLAPGTYSSDPSSSDDQRSARDMPAESTSSANSSRADAGTGGSALPRHDTTRYGHRTLPGLPLDIGRAGFCSKWFPTFSSLRAIPDGKVGPTSAYKAQLTCGCPWDCLRRLRDGSGSPPAVTPRQSLCFEPWRTSPRHPFELGWMTRFVLFGVLGWGFLLAVSCRSFLATDALITVLIYPLLRHRGGPILGSVLILLTLGALEGVSGVQLPSIGVTDECTTLGPSALPSERPTGLIAAAPKHLHPSAARPLPTPCRAVRTLCGSMPVGPPAWTDPLLEEDLSTLLEESCANQHGYPYYLAATLLDVLCAHFARSAKPVLHLQDLVPLAGPVGTTTAGNDSWLAGGVPVRPFPFPLGATTADIGAEVTIGCTPLGFSLGSLERPLNAQAKLCDLAALCGACPEVRRIPNLGWQSICHAHGLSVPPTGILAYTDGSFTPESTVPAKAGWATIFIDPNQAALSAAFGPVVAFPADGTVLSPYVAECYALMAAALIATVAYHDRPIVFLSDCVAAVGVAAGTMTFQTGGVAQAAASAHHFRRQLCCQADVYHHIPGHQGFVGNEIADRASKVGAGMATLSCGLNLDPTSLGFWLGHGATKLPWAATAICSLRGDVGLPPINCPDIGDNLNHASLRPADLIRPFVPEGMLDADSDQDALSSEYHADRPSGLIACPQLFSLRITTFNVLSLGKPKDARPEVEVTQGLAYQPARAALLAAQLRAHNIQVAFLQETRADPGSTRVGEFLRFASGAERGQFGTEIWVRDQHEVTSPAHNTPAARFDKASLVVVYSDVRRLFLRFSSGKLSILLVALHGPHRATEKSIISAWWTHTLTLLQAHQRQSCLLIGGDLNASLGGVTSDHIHWVAPEDEDLPGSWVHDIAKRYALFAPATFPECRPILHLHPKEWWSSLSAGLCTGPSGLGLRTCDLLV